MRISTPVAIIIILICAVLVVGLVFWQYSKFQKENNLQVVKNKEQEDIYKEISKLLNPENNPDIGIDIVKQEGDFAKGTRGLYSGPSGFWWIAKKIDGKWEILGATQEIWYLCDLLERYQVPISLEPICYDENSNEVNRETGWKIWTFYWYENNEEYGIRIEYPLNWYVEAKENPELAGGGTGTPKLLVLFRNYPSQWECYHTEGCHQYTFLVRENFEEIWLKEMLEEEQKRGGIIKNVIVGSEKGYKIISKGGIADDGKQILTAYFYITKDKYLYILFSPSVTEFAEIENLFDKILSTFRFLE